MYAIRVRKPAGPQERLQEWLYYAPGHGSGFNVRLVPQGIFRSHELALAAFRHSHDNFVSFGWTVEYPELYIEDVHRVLLNENAV